MTLTSTIKRLKPIYAFLSQPTQVFYLRDETEDA